MKAAIVFLTLVSLGLAAPQLRKPFHDHFADFMNIIQEEAGHEMHHLNEHYLEFAEFTAALDYITEKNFNAIVHEMEDLPEFKAIVVFLEGHEIDITYFINMINDFIDSFDSGKRLRHELSGKDMSAYIKDTIDILPKEKLAALYDSKMENDEEFKRAMESLKSEEWKEMWNALWENETFKAEADELAENGIELASLLDEIVAIFGQN